MVLARLEEGREESGGWRTEEGWELRRGVVSPRSRAEDGAGRLLLAGGVGRSCV